MVPNHARYQLRYASIGLLSYYSAVAGYTHVLTGRKERRPVRLPQTQKLCVCSPRTAKQRVSAVLRTLCSPSCPNNARNLLRYASIGLLSYYSAVAGYTHVLTGRKERRPVRLPQTQKLCVCSPRTAKQRVSAVLRTLCSPSCPNNARNLLRYASIGLLSYYSAVVGYTHVLTGRCD